MAEPREIQVGMPVRDLDGRRLGKVRRCDPWGFEIVKGLFQPHESVARYDEVLEVRDGTAVLTRSSRDVFDLAAGRLPRGWQARGWHLPSTPPEARQAERSLAVVHGPARPVPSRTPDESLPLPDERRYVATRGESESGSPRVLHS